MGAAIHTAQAKDCEQEANMAAVRNCGIEEVDRQLAATFDETLRLVRSKNPEAARLLSAAQMSWEKFAGDSCAYAVATKTDQMPGDARFNCWIAFTEARIKVLNAYRREFSRAEGVRLR